MDVAAINPATGQTVKVYQEMGPAEVTAAIEQAHETWKTWRGTSFAERSRLMKKTAGILRDRKNQLAELMATEMGKPLKQGVAEAEKCAWVCDYYADNAETILAPETVKTEATRPYVA